MTEGFMCIHRWGVLCRRDSCDGCEHDRRKEPRPKATRNEPTKTYMERPDYRKGERMSGLSKLECERNEAYNEWLEYVQIVTLRRVKLERAESDERAAKQRLDDLNAALVAEQEG